MTAIEVEDLVKTYGAKRSLDRATFAVEEGAVYGFLGRNGAGKTTTLRILLSLARATSGRAALLGTDVARADDALRARIGYLPDVPGYYPWLRAPEFLRFAGSLFGLRGAPLDRRVATLLDMAGLAGVETRIGGYSRGMKQRLGIAQALINAPRLLLLDEPTSALDPIGRKEVLDMISALRGRTTVFFSTHILSDVERVCDTVAILDSGRVVSQGPLEALKQRYGGAARLEVDVDARTADLAAALRAEPWVTDVAGDGPLTVAISDAAAAAHRIPAIVGQLGVGLRRLEPREASLEDVFVSLVGDRS